MRRLKETGLYFVQEIGDYNNADIITLMICFVFIMKLSIFTKIHQQLNPE